MGPQGKPCIDSSAKGSSLVGLEKCGQWERTAGLGDLGSSLSFSTDSCYSQPQFLPCKMEERENNPLLILQL